MDLQSKRDGVKLYRTYKNTIYGGAVYMELHELVDTLVSLFIIQRY